MTRRPTALASAVGVIVATLTLAAQTPPPFAHERPVVTVGAGPQRLPVDAPLLVAAAPFRVRPGSNRGQTGVKPGSDQGQTSSAIAELGLADLRFFAGDRPVPYLLVQPATGEPEWVGGKILTVPATKKTSGFEVDLGRVQPVDAIHIVDLPAPYLKRITLEGSGDRARWTMLVADGTVFDLPDEGLRQDAVTFTVGPYRYLRLIWNDTNSARVPEPRAVRARRASSVTPPPATTIQVSIDRRQSEPGRSRFRIRLPAAALPIVALDLDVGGGHVYRAAVVTESRLVNGEAVPVELGRATLARVTREGVTASALRIPIAAPSEAELDLMIDDGDNAPLDVRSVSVVLAQLPWIYFEAPAGAVVARYGNRALQRPSYDLEAVRDAVDLAKVPEAHWGTETAATMPVEVPRETLPNAGPALEATVFTYSRAIENRPAGLVALPLDAHTLANSRGPDGRFADVRILDGSNRQIPYLIERRDEPLAIDLRITPATTSQAAELKPSQRQARSVYAMPLPYPNLPAATIVIETSAHVFQRTAWIGVDRPPDRYRRDPWFDVKASKPWRHADEETAGRPLALGVGSTTDTDLRLVIDEGDNAPLPITAARLLLPSYRLRFYHPGGPVRLVYGRQDLDAPRYDLALLAPQVMGAAATEIGAAAVTTTAGAEQSPFISPRTFWVVLSIAVVVLLGLIVRLVRTQT
jgi:Protein of unknown function (DUF3999)